MRRDVWCGLALSVVACGSEPEPGAPTGVSAASSSTTGAGGAGGRGGAATSTGAGAGGAGGSAPTSGLVLVGSGDWSPSHVGSIGQWRLDYGTGTLSPLGAIETGPLPTFMAVDDGRELVHVGDEVDGSITTYELMDDTLVERASVASVGSPVHLALDPGRDHLFVAHYGPGRTEVFGLDAAGWVSASLDDVATGGQTHSTLVPADDHLFAASKQDDAIASLTFDGAALTVGPPVATANGSGPRHLALHPDGDVVYLVNELDRTLDTYTYDPNAGSLSPAQAPISLDAMGGVAEGTGADVHVHPSGSFLYVSVRHGGAEGDLVRCGLDAAGLPTVAAHTGTGGQTPRNFAIAPRGDYVFVANQDSANVVLFSVDEEGALTEEETIDVPARPFFVTVVDE